MAENSVVSMATNIFVAPNEAFSAVKVRSRAWLPVLALVVGMAAISWLYMSRVDLPWLMERQFAMAGANMPAEQREQAIEAATRIGPTVYGAIGATSAAVSILVWFVVVAGYYTGVSFITGDGIKFKQWFGLVAWCAFPLVLGLLASIVNLVAVDARFLPQELINPLSFGALFSIDSEGATVVQRILLSRDVTFLWSLVLGVLGYQYFTKRSMAFSAAVALGPLAVIVLVGALIALR